MSEHMLMVDRVEASGEPAAIEAEMVIVRVDEGRARLVLDDGETIEFDAVELRSALGDAA